MHNNSQCKKRIIECMWETIIGKFSVFAMKFIYRQCGISKPQQTELIINKYYKL